MGDNIKMGFKEIGGEVWTEFIWLKLGTCDMLL
jgi:hypothetical protein